MRLTPSILLANGIFLCVAAVWNASATAQQKPPSPAMAAFSRWKFTTPMVEQKTKRLIEIADGIAGKDWKFNHSRGNSKHLSWCRTANRQNQCWMYRPPNVESVHTIVMHSRSKQNKIDLCGMEAFRQDSPRDWGLYIYIGSYGHQQLVMWRESQGQARGSGLSFPADQYDAIINYRGVAHEYNFAIPSAKRKRNLSRFVTALSSPEKLRDAMLADLDALQAHIQKNIRQERRPRTRRAPKSKEMVLAKEGGKLSPPNFGEPVPGPSIGSNAEFDKALAVIVARFDQRRKLIRNDYKALHQEIQKTFPVAMWLGKEQ